MKSGDLVPAVFVVILDCWDKMGRKIIALESSVPYELARMGFVPGTSIEVMQDTWQTNLIRVRCRGAMYFMRRETFNQLELKEEERL
jgi:Fe2+ transport system protein FeoA